MFSSSSESNKETLDILLSTEFSQLMSALPGLALWGFGHFSHLDLIVVNKSGLDWLPGLTNKIYGYHHHSPRDPMDLTPRTPHLSLYVLWVVERTSHLELVLVGGSQLGCEFSLKPL